MSAVWYLLDRIPDAKAVIDRLVEVPRLYAIPDPDDFRLPPELLQEGTAGPGSFIQDDVIAENQSGFLPLNADSFRGNPGHRRPP
jgi:hypothetical protein